LNGIELLWQPHLARLLGDVSQRTELFGYFSAAGFAAALSGALLAPPLADRVRHPAWAAAGAAAAYAATLAVLAVLRTPLAAGVAFAATYVCLGLLGPLQQQLLHERVPNEARVTALSCQSLALMLGVLASSLALSRLAQTFGIPAAWATAAGVLLLSSACYLPLRRGPHVPGGDRDPGSTATRHPHRQATDPSGGATRRGCGAPTGTCGRPRGRRRRPRGRARPGGPSGSRCRPRRG
jgi:MFS family permease